MSPRFSTAILRAQSDERLIELAREGHERAFEALVERYRKPLHRHVRKLLPEARAEDAVQQAFINAWTALQRGVEVREPRAWLYRVAHNAALNALRVQGYEYDELRESLRSHAAGPEEDHERRWVMRRTLAGLATLPEAQREALLRTAVEGRSQERVAAELGLSEGAVRGLVYRARTALRAAATALTPSPLLGWAVAFASGGGPSSTTERIAEVAAGGGTASAGAVLAKAGAVVAVTGALAGGAVAVREEAGGDRDGPAAAKADAVSSRDLGGAGLVGGPGLGPGDDRGRHGRGEGEGRGRGRHRDRGDDHGKGRGKGESGKHSASDDDKAENGADNHGTSGSSGSGSGEDRSGSSGTGTSGSGSGSSGSGSGDDHSGSGSGTSGSGSGSGSGSSGGGSVSSGPGGGGSSGSGVSGSGSGDVSSGDGSSGSGSLTTTTTTTTSSSSSGSSGSGSSGSGSSDSGTSTSSGSGSSGSGSDGR